MRAKIVDSRVDGRYLFWVVPVLVMFMKWSHIVI